MRILIHFDPGPSKDAFLGTRLRKNIKGALELQNIVWVDSIYAKADICHLLSPLDEALAKEAKAIYKVDKIALVNCEIFERYLETFREY